MSLFSITLTPRISETDLVGHVNNVSIAAWFEDLRVRYMASLEAIDTEGEMLHFTLASLQIDFIGETHYGSEVTMSMESVAVGNSSITLEGVMHQNDKLAAKGTAVMVHWHPQTHRPQRIPDFYREKVGH
ncbi:MAG: acyl-CoA thioesterase [Halioglobus sp.]